MTRQRFQVIASGDTVYLRTRLRDLTPTFGSPLGAQLIDVYVHDPGAGSTSTAAAYASRNYTIAPQDAWGRRIEVQGCGPAVRRLPGQLARHCPPVQADQTSR